MNSFLKDIVKESKNEYAGVVADGVEAGDVSTTLTVGHISSMRYSAVVYTAVYLLIKSQQSLANPVPERPSLLLDSARVS